MIGNETGWTSAPFVDFEGAHFMPQTAIYDLPEDELKQVFPGCILTHLLTIASSDHLAVAIESLVAIRASGAGLLAMSLSRHSATQVSQLRLSGLRPHQARLLADRLAALPGVESARVEHQLFRA